MREILRTSRLLLRELALEDAGFILELVNEPGWLRFIGDRGVRTIEDARDYLLKGPLALYARLGFGLFGVRTLARPELIGICGLLKRDSLDDVDLGFAMLARFAGQGYAGEAAAACVQQGFAQFGLRRIVAIVNPDNQASIRVLERIGMHPESRVRMPGEDHDVQLFAIRAA